MRADQSIPEPRRQPSGFAPEPDAPVPATTRSETEVDPGDEAGSRHERRLRMWRWALPATAVGTVAVVRMLLWVRQGSVAQYADYWPFIQATMNMDGSLSLRSLTHFHGQHLTAVPQVLYWANARLFGGSNITLGTFVVALGLGQVALLWTWIHRSTPVPDLWRAALAAFSVTMIFSPHGAWNFLLAMSGTAWLTANLIVIASITAVARDRMALGLVLAVVATFSYGTGISVWPAILAVTLLHRRRWSAGVPVIAVAVPVLAAYLVRRSMDIPSVPASPALGSVLRNTATVVGGFVAREPGLATRLGAPIIVVVVGLGVVAARHASKDAVTWIGLGIYAIGAAATIGYSRDSQLFGPDLLLASRYSSISGFAWLASAGLVAVVLGPRLRTVPSTVIAAGAMLAAVLVVFAGQGIVGDIRASYPGQRRLADALRLGVAQGGPWLIFEPFPDLTPLFTATGHYPFDGRWSGACGLLGKRVPESKVAQGGDDVTGEVRPLRPDPSLSDAVSAIGWVRRPGWHFDCAFVADQHGAVVGIGRAQGTRLAPGAGHGAENLMLVAPRGKRQYRAYVRFNESDRLYRIGMTGATG